MSRSFLCSVVLLCLNVYWTPAMAGGDADVMVVIATKSKKLTRLVRRTLCPILSNVGIRADFKSGASCGGRERPRSCQRLILVFAEPSSDVNALRTTIQRANRRCQSPARLVVLRLESGHVPPALDGLADHLDDHQANHSAIALSGRNEVEARAAIMGALDDAWGQKESPTAPVAVPGFSHTWPLTLAVASTRLPLQQGELRLLSPSGKMLWAAGRRLASRAPHFRRIYSASPTLAGGHLIPLFKRQGTEVVVNIRGGKGFGPHGLVHLWPGGPGAAPSPEALRRFVLEELVGTKRPWPLAPVAGPPALMAAPPWRPTLAAHTRFAATHSKAPPLLFLVTRDGFLHGFDAKKGRESFTFIPAHLLPHIFRHSQKHPSSASTFRVPATPPRLADLRHEGKWGTSLVYGAGGALTLLDVRSNPPRMLPLSAPLNAASRGHHWLTPALASRPDGGLWIVATQRSLSSQQGTLHIGALSGSSASPHSPVLSPHTFRRPTQAVIEADAQTQRLHAVSLGDGGGNLWRLVKPTFSPTRIAKLAPGHAFSLPPAVLRRGTRTLIAAISQEKQKTTPKEAQLVIWLSDDKALVSPLSQLCRHLKASSASCKAPPPKLRAHTQPLLVGHPAGVEILLLLTREGTGRSSTSSFLLWLRLDSRWKLRGLSTRRLADSSAQRLVVLEREVLLLRAQPGGRARLRLLGSVAPSPKGNPQIETYREFY
ncbi:MAG: hypothetical protein JRH20_10185 [Deltaproteobacteria bacterium]|nr:hypothetical protein [Deltaproteobacteria bacterium]